VTNRQTDGQSELRWLRRATAVPAFARKKIGGAESCKYPTDTRAIFDRLLKDSCKFLMQKMTGAKKFILPLNFPKMGFSSSGFAFLTRTGYSDNFLTA